VSEPLTTRLFVIRHGETDWNASGRLQGQLDIPLNDRGRAQAAALGAALADEPIDAVYASDLARAVQTATALARPRSLPVQQDSALRERGFGALEGLLYAEIEQQHPEALRRWRAREPDYAVGGGESLLDFSARCVAAVERLAAAHAGQVIAIVCHGGVLDCLYRAAARIELQAPRHWELGNAGINRLLWSDSGLSLIGWNDRGHLEGG
jgi:probable phosphoglycerate mutase